MSGEVSVRPPRSGDGAAMGLVHVLAWQYGYAHIFPSAFLDGLDAEVRSRMWEQRIASRHVFGAAVEAEPPSVTMVGELDGMVVGICTYGVYRRGEGVPDGPGLSELWGLNVHPDAWGAGVAQALMADAVAELAERHPEPAAALWVLADNARGRRFYEKVGWSADGAEKRGDFGGRTGVVECRYVTDLRGREPSTD